MAKKKAVKKAARVKKSVRQKTRSGASEKTTTANKPKSPATKAAKMQKEKPTGRKTVQPRVWRRMARLADDALVSLEQGDIKEVRLQLEAIRAVALCTDERQQ